MRARLLIAAFCALLLILLGFYFVRINRRAGVPVATTPAGETSNAPATSNAGASPDLASTEVYAHNLMLRKGPSFRFYVRWLRGKMARSHRNVNPSFDDPESFFLDIETGVLRANIGDIANYLNASGLTNSPLKNVTLSGNGDQIKLTGVLHKVIPLPVEVNGTIGATPDGRIQVHITKLNVLKVPFKALLGGFHIKVSDLVAAGDVPGLQVSGDDLFFDTQKLLPPPHVRGHLTQAHIVNPDFEAIYGNAQADVTRVEQWRNFLRLRDGSIDFGKLTMHHVDLIMIDISKDPWFDLDLSNYQKQLVNGYTRMTPEAGLQIFMPDLRDVPPSKANQDVSIEWLKNRNVAPPPEVTPK